MRSRSPSQSWIWFLGAFAAAAGCATATVADTVRRDRAGYTDCLAACRDAAGEQARQAAADPDSQGELRGGPEGEESRCRSDCVAEFRPGDSDGMEAAETGGVDQTQATLDMPPPPPPVPLTGNE